MRRAALQTLGVALAIGCSAPTITVPEATTEKTSVTVETWDAFAFYYNDPTRSERVKHVVDALVSDDGVDVLCLKGVLHEEDRAAILAGTRVRFPHVGFVRTDRSTPIDDPRDLTGVVQTVPTTPPCSNPDELALIDAIAKCIINCRGPDGAVDIPCSNACVALPYPDDPRCQLCARTATLFGRVDDAVATCRDVPRGELAGNGQLPVLLLSRLPLSDVRAHVYPTTMMPHGAVTATVTAGDERFTAMCNSFDGSMPGPYAGVFGAPDPVNGGGFFEQQLGLLRIAELGHALGAKQTTLILGGSFQMWSYERTSRKVRITDWNHFATNFEPIFRPTDVCTLCRANPLARMFLAGSFPDLVDGLMFSSGPAPIVESTEVARTETRWLVDGKPAPASALYSLRAKLTLP